MGAGDRGMIDKTVELVLRDTFEYESDPVIFCHFKIDRFGLTISSNYQSSPQSFQNTLYVRFEDMQHFYDILGCLLSEYEKDSARLGIDAKEIEG